MKRNLSYHLLKDRKMSKKRRLLTELCGEYVAGKNSFRAGKTTESRLSYLAAALQILAHNTNLKEDVDDIIREVFPAFFENDDELSDTE